LGKIGDSVIFKNKQLRVIKRFPEQWPLGLVEFAVHKQYSFLRGF